MSDKFQYDPEFGRIVDEMNNSCNTHHTTSPEPMSREQAGFWRAMWCALFHHDDKRWTPVHHSWDFSCSKCGLWGTIYD